MPQVFAALAPGVSHCVREGVKERIESKGLMQPSHFIIKENLLSVTTLLSSALLHSLFYTSGGMWIFFWIFPFQDPVAAPKEDDGLCHCCLRWDITKSNA